MKQIMCFGDSNTYGYIPENGERYPWGVRWTSLLNEKLGYGKYHIEEEGLCGRTTIFEDPLRDNRNGSHMLPALLETHQHADLIIVMLGTNDCKAAYGASAEMIGKGIEKIVGQIRGGAPDSKILLISPIWLGEKVWKPGYDPEFSEKSVAVSKHLAKVYRQIAEKEAEYTKLFANPYNAAKYGYIDDVIEPRNTRFRIIRALQQLQTKKLTNPAKKHGNIPL